MDKMVKIESGYCKECGRCLVGRADSTIESKRGRRMNPFLKNFINDFFKGIGLTIVIISFFCYICLIYYVVYVFNNMLWSHNG
jgi:hypothetical protein